jgi:hypothetical protein
LATGAAVAPLDERAVRLTRLVSVQKQKLAGPQVFAGLEQTPEMAAHRSGATAARARELKFVGQQTLARKGQRARPALRQQAALQAEPREAQRQVSARRRLEAELVVELRREARRVVQQQA